MRQVNEKWQLLPMLHASAMKSPTILIASRKGKHDPAAQPRLPDKKASQTLGSNSKANTREQQH